MYKLITFVSLLIVLELHLTYVNLAQELLFNKKYKMAGLFLLIGVVGSILTVLANKHIIALQLVIILNFVFWSAFLIFEYKKLLRRQRNGNK